jgi:Uma2 family endonuclease
MISAYAKRTYTVEEYLALDQESEERLEYEDGEIYAMAGETHEHNFIVNRLVTLLFNLAFSKGCRLVSHNIKLKIPPMPEDPKRKGVIRGSKKGKYYYPDLIIAFSPQPSERRIETDPCFVVEVLSKSTAGRDKGVKMNAYLRLANLQRYALISPEEKKIEVYTRHPEGWLYQSLEKDPDRLEIPCIATSITVRQIYRGLKL